MTLTDLEIVYNREKQETDFIVSFQNGSFAMRITDLLLEENPRFAYHSLMRFFQKIEEELNA